MKSTLIIGDIHGCYAEMNALLDKAGIGDDADIIALGDIVDRGPDSPRVLQFFAEHPTARSLMGNHERKHVRGVAGRVRLAQSQKLAQAQFDAVGADYAAAIQFMASLPTYIQLDGYLLVHGFYESGVPLSQQHTRVLVGTMGGEARLKERGKWPWYKSYNGEDKIVVGHRDYRHDGKPLIYKDRVFGLDTSCCHGGALTGLLLPEGQILAVPAGSNYWAIARALQPQHDSSTPTQTDPATLSWKALAAWLLEKDSEAAQAPYDPHHYDYLKKLRTMLEEATALLPLIQLQIAASSQQITTRLVQEVAHFDELTKREQGRLFDAAIPADYPERRLLHMARQDSLTLQTLKQLLHGPDRTLTFADYIERAAIESATPTSRD